MAPVIYDIDDQEHHYWGMLGVRLAKITAAYAVPPRTRQSGGDGPWQDMVRPAAVTTYAIAVDAAAQWASAHSPYTRREFRAICGAPATEAEVVARLLAAE